MLPKLLQILNPEDLRCVQFLRSGRVRVSFREKADRDHFLSEGMRLDDQDIPVTRDAEKVTVLYIRDLPYEVATAMSSTSFPPLVKYSQWNVPWLLKLPTCVMGTVFLRWSLKRTGRISTLYVDTNVGYGTEANQFSVSYAGSLAIGPRPVRYLVGAAIATKSAIWPEIVRRPGT